MKLKNDTVENLDLITENYFDFYLRENQAIVARKTLSNAIYYKSFQANTKVKITFKNCQNSKIFLGKNLRGKIDINVIGNDSLIYIGNNCSLNQLDLRSFQDQDQIIIGNCVTTVGKNVWISGHGSGEANPSITIGDDCMFSSEIIIRNSDGHPIFNLDSLEQVNQPRSNVVIEPHVWIGQKVSILKNVTVGACSVVALGSLVTKDVPRFSIAKGTPALSTVKRDIFWSRGYCSNSINRAKYFVDKYRLTENKILERQLTF